MDPFQQFSCIFHTQVWSGVYRARTTAAFIRGFTEIPTQKQRISTAVESLDVFYTRYDSLDTTKIPKTSAIELVAGHWSYNKDIFTVLDVFFSKISIEFVLGILI